MGTTLINRLLFGANKVRRESIDVIANLAQAKINKEYEIREISANDEGMKDFLFTLGCYEGEKVTVISVLAENFVISVKDARYSIDQELAEAIVI